MRITPKERLMTQQWGLGVSLALLLVENILWGFDLVSAIVLILGAVFFILLFKRNERMKAAKFNVGDLVLYHDGLFRVKEVHFFNKYMYKIGDGLIGWVDEAMLTKADWRDETRIVKRK